MLLEDVFGDVEFSLFEPSDNGLFKISFDHFTPEFSSEEILSNLIQESFGIASRDAIDVDVFEE